jgi:hypothetical protein
MPQQKGLAIFDTIVLGTHDFFTLYYKDTGGGKNDHFLTYFGDYLILFNSIPQKVAKKEGGSTFLLLKFDEPFFFSSIPHTV